MCSSEDASKCSWCSIADSGFVRKFLSECFLGEKSGPVFIDDV